MRVTLEVATHTDAVALTALRIAAARDLADKFGEGPWSVATDTIEGVRCEVRAGQTYLAREEGVAIATLRLTQRNPWLCRTDIFTPCQSAAYLLALVVLPARQRHGVGRECVEGAVRIVTAAGAKSVRLDAFDAPAGAGEFYRRCGFREVHRGIYLGTPLIWFERLV